jgi:hypothetical protein
MAENTTQSGGSKISGLLEKTTLAGAEMFVIADSGSNKKVAASTLKAYIGIVQEASERKLATAAVVNVNQLCGHAAGYDSPMSAANDLTAKGIELRDGALIRYNDGTTWRWFRYRDLAIGGLQSAPAAQSSDGIIAPQPITWQWLFDESELADFRAKQAQLASSDDILVGVGATPNLSLTDTARHAVFDDLWKAAGCTIGTGESKYLCNGIGHTYEEAKYLYDFGHMRDGITNNFYRDTKIKVNLPTLLSGSVAPGRYTFMASKNLLKVDMPYFIPDIGAFRDCTALQSIRCYSPSVQSGSSQDVYLNCSALESITFTRMYELNLDLSYSPLLNLATCQLFVSKYSGSKAITIYVHPTVYAKLTDTSNAQWYAVMTQAVNKKIAFATKS